MSKPLDELKDLTRALRRRVQLSDPCDWMADSAPPAKAKPLSLDEVVAKVKACRACPLGAQRLQAVAEPDTVYISDTVYEPLRHSLRVEEAGSITLKGKTAKIKTFRALEFLGGPD